MMKKRSAGVTFFGYWFIFCGVLGLLPRNFELYSQVPAFLLGTVLSVITVFCGFFILKLHPMARKAAIWLSIISVLSIPFYFTPVFNNLNSEFQYEKRKEYIQTRLKPEFQEKAMADLDKARKVTPVIIIGIVLIPTLVLELLPIYFFTRPKVREQFVCSEPDEDKSGTN